MNQLIVKQTYKVKGVTYVYYGFGISIPIRCLCSGNILYIENTRVEKTFNIDTLDYNKYKTQIETSFYQCEKCYNKHKEIRED